jgi:hypothetical protein
MNLRVTVNFTRDPIGRGVYTQQFARTSSIAMHEKELKKAPLGSRVKKKKRKEKRSEK